MKIGIVSLPLHTNYGGILQAYALITILNRMGHEALFIQKLEEAPKISTSQVIYTAIQRLMSHIIKGTKIQFYNIRREQRTIADDYIIHSQFCESFINHNIPLRVVKDYRDINEGEYDAFVVGSDQVWRPKYFGTDCITDAYLGFAENWGVYRVAYAASFGTEEWEYSESQTAKCRELIQKFNQISVREISGVKLLKDYLNVNSQLVLDPTLLLDKEDYCKLKKDCVINSELLCYVLDSNKEVQDILNDVIRKTQLEPYFLNSKWSDLEAPIKERIQKPVENWIAGFKESKMVMTDSFHACAFSIIFNVPFWVVANKSRGLGRIRSLLGLFELENRLIDKESVERIDLMEEIDWNKVNILRKKYRVESLEFLNKLNAL